MQDHKWQAKVAKKWAKAQAKLGKKLAKGAASEAAGQALSPPGSDPGNGGRRDNGAGETGPTPAERAAAAAEKQVRLQRYRVLIALLALLVGLATLLFSISL